jgi:hypothetical protein
VAALETNSSGVNNTANGAFALFSNAKGVNNTASGFNALTSNSGGSNNTAIGASALLNNTSGDSNTASGASALFVNTTGLNNTANGLGALFGNTSGSDNTAIGFDALSSNTTPDGNTAVGSHTLENNTTGDHNTAIGNLALASNTTGSLNTAIGENALSDNTTGNSNIAAGREALANNTSGFSNVALGPIAGSSVTTADGVICLLSAGDNVSGTTWIENIFGVTTVSGTTAPVVVSDGGQLGTVASSERFKKDIATMEKASEAILSLRPVTFHYKSDAKGTPQFGLIAEEVAKVNPALVLPDKDGKPFTVRYDAVNAMLLNEFLKEHRRMAEQDAIIARQQKQIEALTAGLQKVSAQLQLTKAAPQTVLNNQ